MSEDYKDYENEIFVIDQIKASVSSNDTFEDEKYCCLWDGVYYKDY